MRKHIVGAASAVIIATSFAGVASANTHEVKSGDSLWKIANQYNTSISKLKSLNNLSSDLIHPKQVIFVSEESKKTESNNTGSTSQSQATPEKTSTYTIVSGDTLSKIAVKHKTTVAQLYNLNNLKSDLIFPGQTLKVNGTKEVKPPVSSNQSNSEKPSSNNSTQSNNTSSTTYTVVSGDTLSKIAAKYKTTVANLQKWNNISSHLIYVGQKISINGTSSNASTPPVVNKPTPPKGESNSSTGAVNEQKVIDIAKSVLGTKYVWGGSAPGGFDCSGFIYYAFSQSGKSINRLSAEGYYNRSYYVNKPAIGDLVFFENTYKKGISHLGIYVGNNQFIHSDNDGVRITSLDNSYYSSKFVGFKRFY